MDKGNDPRDSRLEKWLNALLKTPGMTAVGDLAEARRVHVDEALNVVDLLEGDSAIDVGSGGGSPGIPLALARPDIEFVLLDSSEKKCRFLTQQTRHIPNIEVVCARAESFAAGAGRDRFQTALCRALASPPTAIEWCLPLVKPGGMVVLYAGEADLAQLDAVAREIGGGVLSTTKEPDATHRQLVIVEKLHPTPAGYPRRVGRAKKRPIA